MDSKLIVFHRVALLFIRLPVEVDMWEELCRTSPDDGEHERLSQCAGALDGFGGAARSQPYRESSFHSTWKYSLILKRGSHCTFPGDLFLLIDLKQEIQFFLKKNMIIFQIVPKEGKGFYETSPSCHELYASIRQQIDRRKALVDFYRIGRAQHGDSASQVDVFSDGGCGSENGLRTRDSIIRSVMFPDSEYVQSDFICQTDFFD